MHIQKKMKVLGAILAVFLFVAFGIFLSLPSILSTNMGKTQAVRLFNNQIPGTLSVESVSLSWIGSQIFKGVSLKNLEGEPVLTLDSFRTETPLIKFLFSGPGIGKTELKNLTLNIVEEYPEVTNLQQALGNKKLKFKGKKNDVIIRLPLTEIALKSTKPRNFRRPTPIVFQNVDLLIDSATFEKPIVFKVKGETKQGDLLGKFDIDAKFLSGMAMKWQFNRKANVAVKADISNFPVDMLDLVLTLDQPELHGIMRDILGERISMAIDQSLSEMDGALLIKTESPNSEINLIAAMEDGKYILRNSGKISFLLTPEFFDRIASRGRTTSLLRLAKPTQTTITIDDLALPIDFDDIYPNALNIAGLSMHAKLDSQELNFTGSPFWGEVAIREITSTIEANEASQTAIWRLRGEADQNGQHIPIKLEATIYKPKFGENFFESLRNQTNIHIQLAGVPLCTLDQKLNCKPLLSSLFGPVAAVEANIQKGVFSGSVWSDNKLAAIPRLTFNGSVIGGACDVGLAGKTSKNGDVSATFLLQDRSLECSFTAEQLTLLDSSHGTPCEFEKLHVKVGSSDGCETIEYALNGQVFSTPNKGLIAITGCFGKQNSLNLKMHEAPLSQLACFLVPEWKVHKKIHALFGDRANVLATYQNSLINLQFNGPQGKMSAEGYLTDGMVFLSKPLEGEFKVTPLLGKHVLADLSGVFRSVVAAEHPLIVKIEPDEFTFPIKDFTWENVNISQGVVNLGKTEFRKEKEILSLLDLLEAKSDDTVPVWFTPTYFSMKRGVVHIDRFDMLLMENYPLAVWGKVDMAGNKVKMTLGLTKEALNFAFNVKKLEDGYVMHLPIEGKLENASLNKTKAALSISKLLSKNDELLDALFTFSNLSNAATPGPTTQPLPWQ